METPKIEIKSKIKYTDELNKRIKNVVQRYNSKIRRLEKKGFKGNLPEKIKYKDLTTKDYKSEYFSYNKRELTSKLKELEKFTQRGSEELITTRGGVTFTKWEYKKLQKQRNIAIKRINERLEEYRTTDVKIGGVSMGYTYAQTGDTTYENYKDKLEYLKSHKLFYLEKDKLDTYIKNIRVNSKPLHQAIWKKNYIDIVFKSAYEFGINIDDIAKNLMDLSINQFYKAFDEERLFKDLLYQYELLKEKEINYELIKEQYQLIVDEIRENMDKIIENAKTTR